MPKEYRGTKEYILVYAEMIIAARYRGTLRYQEVAKLLGWPTTGQYMGTEIGKLLGAISENEFNHNRPMLSAIVTTVEGLPGPGFFELARSLGKLDSSGKDAERRFWAQECKRVYDTWKAEISKK